MCAFAVILTGLLQKTLALKWLNSSTWLTPTTIGNGRVTAEYCAPIPAARIPKGGGRMIPVLNNCERIRSLQPVGEASDVQRRQFGCHPVLPSPADC
jgi:hypothetical protein